VMNTCFTTSVSGSDRHIQRRCEAAKNHGCSLKSLLPLCCFPTLSPLFTAGNSMVEYFLDRPCINTWHQARVKGK
jgi:hypothetical protein